jgi:hypothetical protein
METQYWATKPIEEIAKQIEAKFDNYRKWLTDSGYAERIKSTYNMFYGINQDGTLHIEKNDKNISKINVNHYKSLVRRLHILVTENKLAFSARSKNSDTKSSIETDLARGIVEYYNDEKGMNATLSESVLGALLMFEYYVYCPWDYNEGFELSVDGGQVVKSGDQKFITRSPFDVAKNTVSIDNPWYIIREKVNKYNLAAQYPEFASEIIAESMPSDTEGLLGDEKDIFSDDEADYVHKFTLIHSRSTSMPTGRQTEVCAGQVLSDSGIKYDKVPVFRISAGDILQTVFKDSPAAELVPIQEALNLLMSGTVTNNLNNATQLIWSADPNLTTKKLSDGQTLVTSSTPPTALNLTGSAAENFKMIDMLKADEQLLSGVNDVARGNPSSNLKSGTSLAVVLAQAIQYVSELQKSYADLASDISSCLVDNIKLFQTEEMTAYIVGSSKKSTIKTFKAADLMDVQRVTCSLGNPLMQSLAGRQEMMQNWMQYGVLKDPKQILSFISTGNLDAQIESDFSDALLIADENEMLRKGEMPIVLITDIHEEHMVKHNKLLSDKSVRENPVLSAGVMEHMQSHIDISRTVPPDLAAAIRGQPIPPPAPPPPPGAEVNPTIDGARMPDVPQGTPEPMAAGYEQQLDAMPQEQGTQEQF